MIVERVSVVPHIMALSVSQDVKRAMLMGSLLEGGWYAPYPKAGGSEESYGPYQINLPYHPEATIAKANDPKWATDYMLGNYQRAVGQVGTIDSAYKAARAAFLAEGPAVMYPSGRYEPLWDKVLNPDSGGGLGVADGSGGTDKTPGSGTPGTGGLFDWAIGPFKAIGQVMESVYKILTKLFLPSTWVRVACFMLGCILIALGLFLFFHGSVPNPVDVAKSASQFTTK